MIHPFKRSYTCTGKKINHLFTTEINGFEPVVYQTENKVREIKQRKIMIFNAKHRDICGYLIEQGYLIY